MPEADPPLAENHPFRSGSRLHSRVPFACLPQAGIFSNRHRRKKLPHPKGEKKSAPKAREWAKEQVEKLLSDMEVILFDEEKKDDKTANGTPKHWPVFHFIAKKI